MNVAIMSPFAVAARTLGCVYFDHPGLGICLYGGRQVSDVADVPAPLGAEIGEPCGGRAAFRSLVDAGFGVDKIFILAVHHCPLLY